MMKKSVIAFMLSAMSVCGCCEKTARTVLCEPYVIEGFAEAPEFWKVRPSQIVSLCESVKVGKSEIICHTPAGQPVYAYFYGEFNEQEPQTNWSAGNSSSAISAYLGDVEHKQTIMLLAGVHGGEPEGVAAAMNMIRLLETGKDFRGQTDSLFLDLASNYRLIIIPCANMDGRAICPDHLSGQPFEVFRAVCQGTWKDGSLVGWKDSKRYFPLPVDKVSFPGGYPNSEGYNIQHDVTPGDMRTEEAKAICRLLARWRVDIMLNAHSCENNPHMFAPSTIDTKRHFERGCRIAEKTNKILWDKGLLIHERHLAMRRSETLNLSSIVNWCSGGFGITLECSSSYDDIHNPKIQYTFDQLMEPVFVSMKVIMEDGLESPLAERIQGGL